MGSMLFNETRNDIRHFEAWCQGKSGFIVCKNNDYYSDRKTGIYRTENRKLVKIRSIEREASQIAQYKNGYVIGTSDGHMVFINSYFLNDRTVICPEKTPAISIVETNDHELLVLFESGNIYKLNSDSAVFKLFLKTEGTKYSMIKYSKKKDLVHLINNFSICCYDYKSSEKIYTSHYHVQIGKFEYDKTEDNFIMSWSGIDLLGKWVFLPDTIVVPLFGIYNIKTGNLLRLKKISIPGDLLAINPISQSEVAFISTNNGEVNYGIFRDRKDALAYDEIQINGSISGEKRGGHHNIANILVDGHGLLIFHINGKFY